MAIYLALSFSGKLSEYMTIIDNFIVYDDDWLRLHIAYENPSGGSEGSPSKTTYMFLNSEMKENKNKNFKKF